MHGPTDAGDSSGEVSAVGFEWGILTGIQCRPAASGEWRHVECETPGGAWSRWDASSRGDCLTSVNEWMSSQRSRPGRQTESGQTDQTGHSVMTLL